jgi:ribonuclease G
MRPTIAGRRLVLMPGQGRVSISRRIEDEALRARLGEIVGGLAEPGEGFVVRTAAADVEAAEFVREAASLRARWTAIQARRRGAEAPVLLQRDLDPVLRSLRDHGDAGLAHVHVDSVAALTDVRRFCAELLPELSGTLTAYREDEPIFERFGVEAAIEEALGRTVDLPAGGRLVIDEAEALSAIDVDTHGASGGGDALFRVNLEAAEEIPRQLRLRAIGGLIVIDFAHLRRDDQQRQVLDALRSALAGDRAAVPPGGFTRLGLVEMTRRRERLTLIEAIGAPCPTCGGRHGIKSVETVALDILRRVARDAPHAASGRITLAVAPAVEAELSRPGNGSLGALSDATGREVELRADTAVARDSHDVVYG